MSSITKYFTLLQAELRICELFFTYIFLLLKKKNAFFCFHFLCVFDNVHPHKKLH